MAKNNKQFSTCEKCKTEDACRKARKCALVKPAKKSNRKKPGFVTGKPQY